MYRSRQPQKSWAITKTFMNKFGKHVTHIAVTAKTRGTPFLFNDYHEAVQEYNKILKRFSQDNQVEYKIVRIGSKNCPLNVTEEAQKHSK